MECVVCGRPVSDGSRFCSSCGARIRKPRAQARPISPLELGAIAGFALAALGTLLPWATIGGHPYTAWAPELVGQFLFAYSFSASFAIDGILVLLYAAMGAYVVLANAGALPTVPLPRTVGAKIVVLLLGGIFFLPLFVSKGGWWQGLCMALLALVELLWVTTLTDPLGISDTYATPGLGLFAAVAGGAAAAFCGFLYAQQPVVATREQVQTAQKVVVSEEDELWH